MFGKSALLHPEKKDEVRIIAVFVSGNQQHGFRHVGNTESIFRTGRRTPEKCREQNNIGEHGGGSPF